MIKNNDLNSTRMKQNRIITLSVAVVLVFAISIPAEAQFGNVLKNAKRNVERKVKNKAETSVDRTTDKAMNKAEKKVMEKTEASPIKTAVRLSHSTRKTTSLRKRPSKTIPTHRTTTCGSAPLVPLHRYTQPTSISTRSTSPYSPTTSIRKCMGWVIISSSGTMYSTK